MYLKCTSEKAAAQQAAFEDVLMTRMCTVPFEDISIAELCRLTGMSRKTFYRLYETKADMIFAMLDHALLHAAGYVPDPSVKRGGMHHFFAYWRSQKKLLDALRYNRVSALLQQQAVLHVLNEQPEIVECFGADDSAYTKEMVMFYHSGLFALVLDWHQRGYDRSIDEMSALAMALFTTPPVKAPLKNNPY